MNSTSTSWADRYTNIRSTRRKGRVGFLNFFAIQFRHEGHIIRIHILLIGWIIALIRFLCTISCRMTRIATDCTFHLYRLFPPH